MLDQCIKCGLCREACPVFRATLNEIHSPRGKAIAKEKNLLSKDTFFCTICKKCQEICPVNFDLKVIDDRIKLVQSGEETKANKEMISNIRKFGNPFGKIKKGSIPKKLYCC